MRFQKRRARPPGDAEPADQQCGDYSREKLLRMDARFIARMRRAIAKGHERRELAIATVVARGGDGCSH